eukprot:XP_017175988.1 PREDICTED: cuticle collagen 2-like [Mus musculus]
MPDVARRPGATSSTASPPACPPSPGPGGGWVSPACPRSQQPALRPSPQRTQSPIPAASGGAGRPGSAPLQAPPEPRVRGIPTEPGVLGVALSWPRLGSHAKPGARAPGQHFSEWRGEHWACSEPWEPSVRKEEPPEGLAKLPTESHLAVSLLLPCREYWVTLLPQAWWEDLKFRDS